MIALFLAAIAFVTYVFWDVHFRIYPKERAACEALGGEHVVTRSGTHCLAKIR